MALIHPAWRETAHLRSVSGVVPAYSPDDGGKWAIYCEHRDETGEIIGSGVVQDTNKRRLAGWVKFPMDWCCYCQAERDEALEKRDRVLGALDEAIRGHLGSEWSFHEHKRLKVALLEVLEDKS